MGCRATSPPRWGVGGSTAEEVARTLDVSGPTLRAHLREVEASLPAELFGSE